MGKHLAANFLTVLLVGLVALAGVIVYGVSAFSTPVSHEDGRRIVLERGVDVHGRVFAPDGGPAVGATVVLND